MINLLIAEFSDIDKLQGDTINIKEVVDSRHYYSHFMDRKKKKNILDGYELYKLTVKLKKLLVCCCYTTRKALGICSACECR